MDNAWNNDDDKDMENLAKETAKKSVVQSKPKTDAKIQLEDEMFMRWFIIDILPMMPVNTRNI